MDSIRQGLSESTTDETVYGGYPDDGGGVIEHVWLSTGANAETAGRYYIKLEGDRASCATDIYTMAFLGVPNSKGRVRSMRGLKVLFEQFRISCTAAILKPDS